LRIKTLLLLLLLVSAKAQTVRDSLSFLASNYQIKGLSTSFNKQLNTYNFNSVFNYSFSKGNYFIGLKENFNSTIVRSTIKNIRDEQLLSIINEYKFSPMLQIGFLLNNNIFSDDRTTEINKASIFNTSAYMKYTPTKELKFIPFIGFSRNEQISENDKGVIYGTEASVNSYKLNEFEINSNFKFQNEDISPRKNTLRFFNFNVRNVFEDDFFNNITGSVSQKRKDFYFNADSSLKYLFYINNNIQSRIESNYSIQEAFSFVSPVTAISFDVIGKLNWREIDRETRYVDYNNLSTSSFDSKVEEVKLEFSGNLRYVSKTFISSFKLSFNEREEKHIAKNIDGANQIDYEERKDTESKKNNQSKLATVALTNSFNISKKHKISLSLYHRKLVYDTPHEENYDDRDELMSIGRLLYFYKFNYLFDFYLNLEGSFNKIVYIFSERSANNNIRRTVKFSGGGIYKGKNFRNKLDAEISANYTSFDFEDLSTSLRSFSFRQFAVRDSSTLRFNKRFGINFDGYVKLSEQGEFAWSSFSSKPVRFLEEIYTEPKFVYYYSSLKFAVGFRLFSLKTFNYNSNNKKVLNTEYTSIGPATEFTVSMNNELFLRLYGYFEFINNENNETRKQASLNVRMDWNF
jgi:hypothetical protein